ncbi:peptide-binding protein [Thiomicrorhabdus immobilis]|uniref:Peptide-binding protein n=1 Tax=Thiomicrorhabdus immobilis TaxID=2791037 RepID=A0ABM7MDI9_9GAMM|nr:ABC transporter substrate-binding protein [Thiomicrorhabdus immobilis]BCN93461.1 peptide-binding protein [Thiomicrorhabdus immobilis]
MNINRRQFVKNSLVATSSLGLAGLVGCHSQAQSSQILVGITARPRMLDPRKATDALSSRINRLLYRQLIDFNERFEAVPDLASWQQVSDTRYVFTLQEISVFHNGQPLTAEDVAATYQSILDPDFGSAHRGSLKGITSIKVLNPKQVEFVLEKADALFVGRLVIGILPKNLLEQQHPFHEKPVGSGACEFVSLSEQKLVIQRRNDHIQLVFIPVKDATVRVLKLKKGELDIIQNDLSPELVQYCLKQPELAVTWHKGTNLGYIGFNFEDPLLAQPELRQAIAHGIDRQAIVDAMFSGHARLAGGLLVPEHWCGVEDMPAYEYNPQKAKSLLKELDFSSLPAGLVTFNEQNEPIISLSYKTSNDPTRIRLATIYQSQLKQVGIHLNIQSYDWGTFYSDIKKGRFQLYSLAWVGIKSPDIFQYVFDSEAIPPSGANRGRYRDAEADALIRSAGKTQELAKQAELYQTLQRHLQKTLATMPLWYEDQYAVARKGVSGNVLYSDGRLDGLLDCHKV